MLEVDVFVAAVEDLEDGSALLAQFDCGENEVGLVEVESGEAGLCAHWHFHVASRDVYFSLVDEELQVFLVLSRSLSGEEDFDDALLEAFQFTLCFVQLEG